MMLKGNQLNVGKMMPKKKPCKKKGLSKKEAEDFLVGGVAYKELPKKKKKQR